MYVVVICSHHQGKHEVRTEEKYFNYTCIYCQCDIKEASNFHFEVP